MINHQTTYMTEEKAIALTDKLNDDDTDDWHYCELVDYNRSFVRVYDDKGEYIGNL